MDDGYNYANFSFDLEEREFTRWLADGPRPGVEAPDFELDDLDGEKVRLSTLRGKPVVLEFGSYTCPIFSDRVPEMERLAISHPEVTFLVIAVREAHPGEVTGPHRSQTEKRRAARCLAIEEGLRRRVLIDDLQGSVHRAYGGAWNPVYVVDSQGRIAFRRAWNDPSEVRGVLDVMATGAPLATAESIEMVRSPGRAPTGLRLLERGGRQALLDFYRTAPPPVRQRLRDSASEAVRAVVGQEDARSRPALRSPAGTNS